MVSVSTSPVPHPVNTYKVYRITDSMHEEQLSKELYSLHIKCIIDRSHVIF